MTHQYLFFFFLACIACGVVTGQNIDELQIPVENDNQFPPENPSQTDESFIIEGSGTGVLEEPENTTTELTPRNNEVIEPIEDLTLIKPSDENSTDEFPCPKPCVCNIEGGPDEVVINCSGYELSEFPEILDSRTTTLNVQNNKLTVIPKSVSKLKKLRKLYANNNLLTDLESGSISELPELVVLNLANNRLIEYPKDLKNSFGLSKLEYLDLGGNDMRTELSSDLFTIFTSLKQLTLPSAYEQFLTSVCTALKSSLESTCSGTCKDGYSECPEAPNNIDDELISVKENNAVAFRSALANVDPISITTNEASQDTIPMESDSPKTSDTLGSTTAEKVFENTTQTGTITEAPKATINGPEVKVGATTSQSSSGGVDKSVIGIIVAAMVVIVAGITIKKNWSSIKKRFSSNPRPANERNGVNTNGGLPEEVPLQEKSPV